MSGLHACGVCCLILSIWGVLQLVIMGAFYHIESTPLLDDVMPDQYDGMDDFLEKLKENYAATARNCWIAAGIYAVLIILSLVCIFSARRTAKKKALLENDDDMYCKPRPKKMSCLQTLKMKKAKNVKNV